MGLDEISLPRSYAHCDKISRTQAANFYPAFRVLPTPQKKSMCALYAFLRIADDLSDEPGALEQKQKALADWRQGLEGALSGTYTHPIHPALHHTVEKYAIPPEYLHAAVDGVEMDLQRVNYNTFKELQNYCFHVASVVGLSCIHIWGFRDESAKEYAILAGIAFQLTNILRDLGEDAARGRIYLPAEDLQRFGYDREQLLRGDCNRHFKEMMEFQVSRARDYYQQAWPLVPMLSPPGRAVFLVMARTYRSLLDAMEKQDYDVFTKRVRLSRWQKLYFALSSLPAKWGWFS